MINLGPNRIASVGQISEAVGISPRAVRSALGFVQPSGSVVRNGNVCGGYSFEQLPERLQERVVEQQTRLNYRSPEEVLLSPTKQWQPSIPLSEQPPEALEYAHALRRALSFYLDHRNDLTMRPGQLIDRARRDWKEAFRKPVSRRHVENMVAIVLERDRGREELSRAEIYLPSGGQGVSRKTGDLKEWSFVILEDSIQSVSDLSALNPAERAIIWRSALDEYSELIGHGHKEKKAKRLVLEFLQQRVPRLSESWHALRKQFDRKLSAFELQGVSGLSDKRRENSGPRRISAYTSPDSLSDDERLLLGRANSVGGGISQANRELHTGIEIIPGQLLQFSDAYRAAHPFDPRTNKSYVPQSVRDKLRPLLKSIEPLNHGPKAARLAAPSIHRDWSNVLAGAWYQSDDETGNHYIWFQCEDGDYEFEGMRFDVLRPQILPLLCVRTDYVLSVLLICRRQYNSRDIRSLILKTCLDERVGLPFEGFYFEQGSWKARNVEAMVKWTEIDDAFTRSGLQLRLRHATTPKAKIIERIFSQEQNSMQALPGYAGRNEMTAGYERVRASLVLMKRVGQPIKAEVAPWDHFMSADQYLDQLQRAYERFNAEPQTGKRLNGMSPAEAWKALSGGRAHHLVPDSLRYLLATEETEATVTREGVRVRIGTESRYFVESARLGSLIGEKVIVRWNQDFPDHVICVHPKSDPSGKAPFVVRYEPLLDALNASDEDFSEARRRRKTFLDPQRSLFRVLSHDYGRTIRDELLGNSDLRLAGEAHNGIERASIQAKPSREAAVSNARKSAIRAGIDPRKIKNVERAGELDSFEEARARLRHSEAEQI
jgi:hypothetical protein